MDLIKYVNRVAEGMVSVKAQPFTNKEDALALAQEAQRTFERILKRAATKDAKIRMGIKPEESIDNKLERWKGSGRGIDTMFDILRGSIYTNTQDEVEQVVRNLSRGPTVAKYEIKEKPDKYGYYGSHHLDLYIPEYKLVAEIQIMTKAVAAAKKVGHKIYSKYRSDPAGPPADQLAYSRQVYRYGNRPKIKLKRKPESSVDPSDH